MEAVAATDVDDAGRAGEVTERMQQPPGLEPSPHRIHEPEPILGKRERVVVIRVNAIELAEVGPTVEVDHATAGAPDRQETVGRCAVFEIGPYPHGLSVASSADTTGRGDGEQWAGRDGFGDPVSGFVLRRRDDHRGIVPRVPDRILRGGAARPLGSEDR